MIRGGGEDKGYLESATSAFPSIWSLTMFNCCLRAFHIDCVSFFSH